MLHDKQRVPDALPAELKQHTVDGLATTIEGLVNESTLSRAQILGALKIAEWNILMGWRRTEPDDEGEQWQT